MQMENLLGKSFEDIITGLFSNDFVLLVYLAKMTKIIKNRYKYFAELLNKYLVSGNKDNMVRILVNR